MRKKIKLAVVAALALGATSVYATNGDSMIGQGAKSRSMGGVGIAKSFGAESALANPANISSVKNSEFTGALTVFMPDVEFKSDAAANANPAASAPGYGKSDADLSVIPEFYYASRINDKMVYGVSIAGTAGMGVDYDDLTQGGASDNGSFQMKTELQLLKVAVPFAYDVNDALTLGVSPILQYGTLEMSHQSGAGMVESPKSSDTSFGYELGATYDITPELTLGAVYKSKIAMKYDNTISGSITAFGGEAQTGVESGDKLDQPAEYGVGVSYVMGKSTIALDYKNIAWGSAAGYSDFGWEDQDVIAIGYEYATKHWALRAGYNHASSPIKEQSSATNPYGASVQNFFNLAGFPGMVESHYTFGGGYQFTDALGMDFAVVYAAEETNSFDTTGMTQAFVYQGAKKQGATDAQAAAASGNADSSSADVKHSQLGFTIAMTYKF